MHGQGAFTYVDGSKYVGEVKENMPWKGTSYDKDDNVTATYSEGVEKPVN
jgi:beta-lactam-binding protein with PASTA domain